MSGRHSPRAVCQRAAITTFQALEGLEFLLGDTSKATLNGKKGGRREILNIPLVMLLRAHHRSREPATGWPRCVSVNGHHDV